MSRRAALAVLAAVFALHLLAAPVAGMVAVDIRPAGSVNTSTTAATGLLTDTPTVDATPEPTLTDTPTVDATPESTLTAGDELDGTTGESVTPRLVDEDSTTTLHGVTGGTLAAGEPVVGAVDSEQTLTLESESLPLEAELSGAVTLDSGEPAGGVVRADPGVEPTPAPDAGADEAVVPGSVRARSRSDAGSGRPSSPVAGGLAAGGGALVLAGLAGRAAASGGTELPQFAAQFGHTTWRRAVRAAAGLGDRVAPFLGAYGYQRHDGSNPIEHDGRERLHDLVHREPGIHLSALSQTADIPLSTARYHLRVLEREGLITGTRIRGRRRYLPPDVQSAELAAALAEPATSAVLQSLVADGPASVTELAGRLDRDPSTVSHHLDRLESDELIVRERDGRAIVSRVTPPVVAAISGSSTREAAPTEKRPVASTD